MRSKPVEKIVAEAKKLLASGVVELNLIGQDTTSYGYDIGYTLRGLLVYSPRSMMRLRTQFRGWIRLMYAYPFKFHRRNG